MSKAQLLAAAPDNSPSRNLLLNKAATHAPIQKSLVSGDKSQVKDTSFLNYTAGIFPNYLLIL